jgi:hypothetical protein
MEKFDYYLVAYISVAVDKIVIAGFKREMDAYIAKDALKNLYPDYIFRIDEKL